MFTSFVNEIFVFIRLQALDNLKELAFTFSYFQFVK